MDLKSFPSDKQPSLFVQNMTEENYFLKHWHLHVQGIQVGHLSHVLYLVEQDSIGVNIDYFA